MQDGGFISWDEWKPILNTFNCPCCMGINMGVKMMITEEELEQIITARIDEEREKMMDVHLSGLHDGESGE